MPAGDEDALALALDRLRRDDQLGQRLGRQGREWVIERCRPGAAAGKYHEIFRG